MTFCFYELPLHQDTQERLRGEIDIVLKKHEGKITYEAIQEMEYLDKVVAGMRFGLMQTKVGLVYLLSKYRFCVCKGTAVPLVLHTKSFILFPLGGMWLQIEKRFK